MYMSEISLEPVYILAHSHFCTIVCLNWYIQVLNGFLELGFVCMYIIIAKFYEIGTSEKCIICTYHDHLHNIILFKP